MSYWTQTFQKLFHNGPETVEVGKWEGAELECLVGRPSLPSFGLTCPCCRLRLTFQNQSGLVVVHTWTQFCWLLFYFFIQGFCFQTGDQTSRFYLGVRSFFFFYLSPPSPICTRSAIRSADHTGPMGDDEGSFSPRREQPHEGLCFYFYTRLFFLFCFLLPVCCLI